LVGYGEWVKQVSAVYSEENEDITLTARRLKTSRVEVIEAVGLSDLWASIYWNEDDNE
jgi:hypothetical protein